MLFCLVSFILDEALFIVMLCVFILNVVLLIVVALSAINVIKLFFFVIFAQAKNVEMFVLVYCL